MLTCWLNKYLEDRKIRTAEKDTNWKVKASFSDFPPNIFTQNSRVSVFVCVLFFWSYSRLGTIFLLSFGIKKFFFLSHKWSSCSYWFTGDISKLRRLIHFYTLQIFFPYVLFDFVYSYDISFHHMEVFPH